MSRVFSSANTGANENYVHTPASGVYNNLQALTWSIWVNPKSLGGASGNNGGTVFVKDPTNNYSPYLQFAGNGTATLTAIITGTLQPASTTAQVLIPLSAWTNVILTFDMAGDKKLHMYINGVETVDVGALALVGTLDNDSGDGYYFANDTFDDAWDGDLAEAAIWNTVLTGPQITAVAASTTGVASIQTANLVGYWHLCGTMSPEPDIINGNSGVLSTNPPTQGSDSPGFSCSGGSPSGVGGWMFQEQIENVFKRKI